MLAESLDVATARIHRLVGDAVLAVWEGSSPSPSARLVPHSADAGLPRPHASFLLPTSWGGTRTVMALRWPQERRIADLDFKEADRTVASSKGGRVEPFDPAALVNGLTPSAKAKLVSALLEFCHTAFGRKDERRFAALCRALLAEVIPEPSALLPVVAAVDGLVLCEGVLPTEFGAVRRAIVVDRAGVRPLAAQPLLTPSKGGQAVHVMTDVADDPLVVLFGESGGLACRAVKGEPGRVRLVEWLERRKAPVPAALRDYVGGCLAAHSSPRAASVLEEMQVLAPLARKGVFSKTRPVGAEIDLAIALPEGGLFVAGWLHDPLGMVERIEAVSPLGERLCLGTLHRFPRADVAGQYGEPAGADRSGFVTYLATAPSPVHLHQYRFELSLRSGARLDVVPALPPRGAAEARNAVLGVVPPAFVTPEVLETCIAPAAAALHAAHMATRGEPEVIRFGAQPPAPAVSVVVPLYKVLDFLRFQLAAFAVDPAMAGVELIFVLDSPEQRHEVEHLLTGLHALYNLPLTLVVQTANYGFSSACNTGARAASGAHVLFLNSDVIPDRPGWLPSLVAAMEDPRLVAVGPKLLFDDQSLQHAGMYFGRDLKGGWMNLHYHKGLPRDFAPACEARLVPGVTGAAILVRAAAFEAVGGFSESYIIGDYEDSDLCLKLRAAGWEIGYRPEAELFHLERQSIQKHDGYMRGVACLYNRRLHSGRWADLMERLCPAGTGEAA